MNRTVVLTALVLVVLLVEGIAQTQSRIQTHSQPGRYQLFSAEHAIEGPGSEKTILRIDTATGKVDEWNYGRDSQGKIFDEWTPTGELLRNR